MKTKISKILIIITSIHALLIFETLTSASEGEVVNRKFIVQGAGLLTLESAIGNIQVISHEENSVIIDIYDIEQKRNRTTTNNARDNLSIDFEQDGNDIFVRVKYKNGKGYFSRRNTNKMSLYFRITVPKKFDLDLNTAGGKVDISDINGKVKAFTSGGGMKLNNINGDVSITTSGGYILLSNIRGPTMAKTSGGNIEAIRSKGNLDLRTSGGNISISESYGSVEAKTSGGNIDLDTIIHHFNARTSGGNIKANILAINNDSELKTSGGNIHVFLDPDVQTDFKARSSGGNVSTDIPIIVLGDVSKNQVEGQINGGGPELILQTSGGHIKIKRLGAL